jgi:hypothetical protein
VSAMVENDVIKLESAVDPNVGDGIVVKPH